MHTRYGAGDADVLLRLMDEAGINRAIIASEDCELAFCNAVGNDRMFRLSGRFRATR